MITIEHNYKGRKFKAGEDFSSDAHAIWAKAPARNYARKAKVKRASLVKSKTATTTGKSAK